MPIDKPSSLSSGLQDFENAIIASLDMQSWDIELDLTPVYERIGREVLQAVKQEENAIQTIREKIFPEMKVQNPALPFSGIQKFSLEQIQKVHNGLLFNGGVTAVDGTIITHDTLPVTITQIGICAVKYNGTYGSYAHRLFRRDLQLKGMIWLKKSCNY
jgi:hypothetical protein